MRRFIAASAIVVLAACAGGSPAPDGWQQVPGETGVWANGTSAQRQTYAYSKEAFEGSLQDLAQREIVNAALRDKGVKFVKSDVFAPCPGTAAIATFAGAGQTVQDGFAVTGGYSIVVRYDRPTSAHDSPAAVAAMQRALCVAPG